MRVGIIGDGISSLSLAKALINENIYVDIFTTKKNNKINKSRTIGISKSNIEYFNSNIINIDKLIWKIKHIEIFSENSRAFIDLVLPTNRGTIILGKTTISLSGKIQKGFLKSVI